ncbi:aspartyl protease family protein [Ancylothrix sp. C2]|uniref:retroviral-like aspartic protease family protein n=1 Tax=Ancylothrix sp. D3o TaxID=2953691 RepID=UPI0021BB68CA|nr:retroviral-like aspartic protease family protein [Ancylothrix sp. D3o]MCT7949473.1 aspartyl protease family protein [Ancylothrix sp. D3o]
MPSPTNTQMGKVTTTITVTNEVDQILAERGFIPVDQIRSITLHNVLVDTGATRLCLPAEIISQLGLTPVGEIVVKTAAGNRTVRVFKNAALNVEGREGSYSCIELPGGEDPLLGVFPLEDLALEPDLKNQCLRHLPIDGNDTYHTIY